MIEPAIPADERLRRAPPLPRCAKDFPEPYRTIIVRTANRGTPAGIPMVSDRRSAAVTAAGRTTHRCVCRICGEAYDVTDSRTAREGPGEVARAGPC